MIPVKINEFLGGQSLPQVAPAFDGTVVDVAIDSRKAGPGTVFFALEGERTDGHRFLSDALSRGALCCIAGKGKAGAAKEKAPTGGRIVEVDDPVAVLGKLGSFVRSRLSCLVIGITGSIGKTTTKEILASLLSSRYRTVKAPASFNNHLGVPLTLCQADEKTEVLVAELGANHGGEIRSLASILRPDDGIIVHIAPVHLEGFGSLSGVVEAKGELAEALPGDGTLFMDASIHGRDRFAERARCRVALFGDGTSARYEWLGTDKNGMRFRFDGAGCLYLEGGAKQHLVSAACAVYAALSFGVDPECIRRRLAAFQMPGLRWSVEPVEGRTLISDCYNASPQSVREAVEAACTLEERGNVTVVLGDMLELGDASDAYHYETGRFLAGTPAVRIYLLGPCMAAARDALHEHGFTGEVRYCADSADTACRQDLAEEIAGGMAEHDRVLFKASRRCALESLVSDVRDILMKKRKVEVSK